MSGFVGRMVQRAIIVREQEIPAVVWSWTYFFLVLSSYFVLRPIRDEMGVVGGVENLAWLFTGTLVGMLLLHPLYTYLVSRLSRRRFVTLTYRFFVLNLVIFFLLLRYADAGEAVWIGRAFFIWTSVMNLFVVSVFWSFMTDVYRPGQGKRIFGLIAVGGTIGAISGASITSGLVGILGPVNLLLVSALLLELAGRASSRLERHEGPLAAVGQQEEEAERAGEPAFARGDVEVKVESEDMSKTGRGRKVIGGGMMDGIRHVARSPYLLGIAALMMFFSIVSTFLYFQRIDIVARALDDDPIGRTRLFANMEIAVQSLTLLTQIFLTGRLLRWLGVGICLAFLPFISAVGFAILGAAPVLIVVVGFEVLRRAGNFAIQRPAREVLYTVLSREDKYKAKNFNDTFVYRLGDQTGAWSYHALGEWIGLGLSGLALTMVPVSALWLVLALWLGRHFKVLESAKEQEALSPVGSESGVA